MNILSPGNTAGASRWHYIDIRQRTKEWNADDADSADYRSFLKDPGIPDTGYFIIEYISPQRSMPGNRPPLLTIDCLLITDLPFALTSFLIIFGF